ncbi:MAG TPA: ribonuclease HII [Moheibacter sp.]|nr:ribonuclease HII [Moheibacter sp.]
MERQFDMNLIEAGCDEAGRGCLAGPVVAAAVILNEKMQIDEMNDSKKLSPQRRIQLRKHIEENALAWAVAFVEPEKIDEINILNASILAMHLAIDQLKVQPEHIAVDGNRFKEYPNIPSVCVIKGDAKYSNIAAASILAKTYRDEFMEQLHEKFPVYNWQKNKGYPTIEHRLAIMQHGICVHHRKTFKTSEVQMELKL